jgi:hypothetical protein
MLSVTFFIVMLNVVMLSVVMLNVVMLNVIVPLDYHAIKSSTIKVMFF